MNEEEIITKVLEELWLQLDKRYTYDEESTEKRALDRLSDVLKWAVWDRKHKDGENE